MVAGGPQKRKPTNPKTNRVSSLTGPEQKEARNFLPTPLSPSPGSLQDPAGGEVGSGPSSSNPGLSSGAPPTAVLTAPQLGPLTTNGIAKKRGRPKGTSKGSSRRKGRKSGKKAGGSSRGAGSLGTTLTSDDLSGMPSLESSGVLQATPELQGTSVLQLPSAGQGAEALGAQQVASVTPTPQVNLHAALYGAGTAPPGAGTVAGVQPSDTLPEGPDAVSIATVLAASLGGGPQASTQNIPF